MKKISFCVLLLLALPAIAVAAQVFGRLRLQGGAAGKDAQITITCSTGKSIKGKTDTKGSYSLYVPGAKKCDLTVNVGGKESLPYKIFSDKRNPVRYDFELIHGSDGRLMLRRR